MRRPRSGPPHSLERVGTTVKAALPLTKGEGQGEGSSVAQHVVLDRSRKGDARKPRKLTPPLFKGEVAGRSRPPMFSPLASVESPYRAAKTRTRKPSDCDSATISPKMSP